MSYALYESTPDRANVGTFPPTASRPALPTPLARTVLATAVFLGVTADGLFHNPGPGLGFALWIALVGMNAVVLVWSAGRHLSRETALWLATAAFFAAATAWRNSETLQAFDILAVLACLGMAAVATRDSGAALFARRLRDTVFTAADVVLGVAVGVLPLAFREALLSAPGHSAVSRVRVFVRPALIAAAALLVFGSLLRGADPIFASLVSVPSFDMGLVAEHVVVTGFFTWIVAGWARAGLATNATPRRSSATLPIQLDGADVTAALGTLIVLFAAFIATQLGWFFGGERFLQARTGLTAATYARQGFFQMVAVVALVVPLLVATRAALRPDPALARRHTLLSLPVIALLGAIMVSATLRLKMYVHYYGLTTDRLFPLVFMFWLAVVVAWLAITVLRNWGRPFVAGAVISGLSILMSLNAVDPDALVARVNIARAAKLVPGPQPSLDLNYLATLNGRGVALAIDALLDATPGQSQAVGVDESLASSQRCVAARRLMNRFGPESALYRRWQKSGAWRYWNRDDALGLRTVAANRNALTALASSGCREDRS